ncbi:hypothetical protein D3C80_1417990 [compost metagenome]
MQNVVIKCIFEKKIFYENRYQRENELTEQKRQYPHNGDAKNHAEAPAFFLLLSIFLLLRQLFRLCLILGIGFSRIIKVLGAFGAGIYNTDNAAKQRNPAQFDDPALIALRHLQKCDFLILPPYGCYVDMLAAEHDAFDNGLAAVTGSFLGQPIHLPALYYN